MSRSAGKSWKRNIEIGNNKVITWVDILGLKINIIKLINF